MVWWHQLLMTVGGALLVGLVYYSLQVRRLGSAARERLLRAHKELVDTIEMDVINGQEISRDVISRLIKATSRAHNVDLEPVCSPISLAEDVELRLQTNRYLEPDKKQGYVNRLRAAIENMQAPEGPRPVWEPEELRQLKAAISADNKEQALQITERLSKQAYVTEIKLSQLIRKSEARQVWVMAMMISAAVAGLAGIVTYLVQILR